MGSNVYIHIGGSRSRITHRRVALSRLPATPSPIVNTVTDHTTHIGSYGDQSSHSHVTVHMYAQSPQYMRELKQIPSLNEKVDFPSDPRSQVAREGRRFGPERSMAMGHTRRGLKPDAQGRATYMYSSTDYNLPLTGAAHTASPHNGAHAYAV